MRETSPRRTCKSKSLRHVCALSDDTGILMFLTPKGFDVRYVAIKGNQLDLLHDAFDVTGLDSGEMSFVTCSWNAQCRYLSLV